MSAIPYQIAKEISDVLHWPRLFYRTLFEILITADGIGFMLKKMSEVDAETKPFTYDTVYFPVRHIIYRTIQFSKAIEFIRPKDIMNGMPTLAIAGCGLSDKTIRRVLREVSPPQNDFFVKLRLQRSKAVTPMYGLNIPVWISGINTFWQIDFDDQADRENAAFYDDDSRSITVDSVRKGSDLARRAKRLLEHSDEFASHYEEAFRFLREETEEIKDLEKFKAALADHCPDREERMWLEIQFQEKARNCRIARRRK